MGYGPQGGGGGSGSAENGFDVNQTPALTPGYRNALDNSDNLAGADWVASNLTVTRRDNVLSPLGGNAVFEITDASANLGTLTQAIVDAFSHPDYTPCFLYVAIDAAYSSNAQFSFVLDDGSITVNGTINVNCQNGATISTVAQNCAITTEAIEVATQTWLKITVQSNQKLSTPCDLTVTITPAAASAGAQDNIIVSSPFVCDWSIEQDVSSTFTPAYLGTGASGAEKTPSQPVRIPSSVIDWGQKFFNPGANLYEINLSSDLNRIINLSNTCYQILLPDLSSFPDASQWNGFTCFLRTIATLSPIFTGFDIEGANAATVVNSYGPIVDSGVVPVAVDLDDNNVTFWRLTLEDASGDGTWSLSIEESISGRMYCPYDGIGFGLYIPFGLNTLYITGAAGGGRGGNGSGTASGGGGGSGESCYRQSFSVVQYQGSSISINPGIGATQVQAATDSQIFSGVTPIFTLLAGANGGGGGAGANGAGGAAGGPGGQNGETMANGLLTQPGAGGGNIAGGVGGHRGSSDGLHGAGGAGGPVATTGGDGGDGFFLLEW